MPEHQHTIVKRVCGVTRDQMFSHIEVEECSDPKCSYWRSNCVGLGWGRAPSEYEQKRQGSRITTF